MAGAVPNKAPFHLRRLLWGTCADCIVFCMTIGFAVTAIVLTLLSRRISATDAIAPTWGRWVLKVCGVGVDLEGLEHVDRTRSYVIIANHLSNFDVWVTLAALPLNIRFVAKKELTRLPFFGQALAMSDHVVINRSHPEEAIARINARVARAAAQGSNPFCIVFYAEGSRSPDGRIHAFKKGGVNLAIRTGLPIIPLSISGTWKLLPKSAWIIRPGGRVKLVLDRPIETSGYQLEQRDELNDRVREIVIRNFAEGY